MKAHDLKHLLSELVFLVALVFPFAITLASLVGSASWLAGGSKVGLWAWGVTWSATMVIVPILARCFWDLTARLFVTTVRPENRFYGAIGLGKTEGKISASMFAMRSSYRERFPMTPLSEPG